MQKISKTTIKEDSCKR